MSDSQFSEACRLLVTGKYEDAAHCFHEMLQGDGDHPSVRYNLGLSLECCKNFQDAAKEYSTVIREFPDYAPAYLGMANCYFYEGNLEQCEGMLYAAREADPTDPRAAILLAEILILRGSEKKGIAQHIEALSLIDAIHCFLTHNHALCYGDFGMGGEGYYAFWENSLLQRGFPELPHPSSDFSPVTTLLVVLLAHGGNAADISRRLKTLPRESVYLVTLDDITHTILADYAPDMHLSGISYELHELPALYLHVGNHLLQSHGVTVLLPADDGGDDTQKLVWAAGERANGNEFAVSPNGDVVSSRALDARRVPPVLGKGHHAAPDTFAKLFSFE